MNKNILKLLLVSLLATTCVFGDATINWASTTSYSVLDENGDIAIGSRTDDMVGYLVQLIYAGPDGDIDPVDPSDLHGVGGDDVYQAYGWVGRAMTPAQATNGHFNAASYLSTQVNNAKYYIRAWSAPTASTGTGQMPTGGGVYYGNTGVYSLLVTEPPTVNEMFLTSDLQTTMEVVPEPTTIALAVAGIGLLIVRRFRKKK